MHVKDKRNIILRIILLNVGSYQRKLLSTCFVITESREGGSDSKVCIIPFTIRSFHCITVSQDQLCVPIVSYIHNPIHNFVRFVTVKN